MILQFPPSLPSPPIPSLQLLQMEPSRKLFSLCLERCVQKHLVAFAKMCTCSTNSLTLTNQSSCIFSLPKTKYFCSLLDFWINVANVYFSTLKISSNTCQVLSIYHAMKGQLCLSFKTGKNQSSSDRISVYTQLEA